ncbi:hypothetical protein [Amycolatopsis sp. NPDC004625]|uniref:hypothetical protein n=1 Tax=Amycolatopsis sp. NPDC004625 TaxID=3154670 RepID=UPI0033AE56D7
MIVDRDPLSRLGLRSIVAELPDTRGTAVAGGTEAARAVIASQPDVVQLRSNLDFDGRLTRELLCHHPGVGVLVVVDHMHQQRWYLEMQRAAGVRGLPAAERSPDRRPGSLSPASTTPPP